MKLFAEYTFHGSHWNEKFASVEDTSGRVALIHQVAECDPLELLRNIHGHLWTVRIEVEGDETRGLVANYNNLQAIIATLDFTFLPLNPLILGYLKELCGVESDEEVTLLGEWGSAGNLEVVLNAITAAVIKEVSRPGIRQVTVTLYETGPAAHRNVRALYAEQTVAFTPEGVAEPW